MRVERKIIYLIRNGVRRREYQAKKIISFNKRMRVEGERTNRSTVGASIHSRFFSSKGNRIVRGMSNEES